MIQSDRVPDAASLYADLDGRSLDGRDADGQRLHYLRAGDADDPAVVLLHGSGIDDAALSWRHVVPALAENYRVYAPDWPGYGDSPSPEAVPDVPFLADVLNDFLDEIAADRPALVGISMGAAAALAVALDRQASIDDSAATDRPEPISGLGLVSSYGLRDEVPGGTGAYLLANTPFAATLGRQFAGYAPGGARAAIAPFVADPSAVADDFVEAVSERLGRSGAGDAWMAFQRAEFGPNGVRTHFGERLSELAVPTLFVHGDSDPLIPLSWAREAAAVVPDAELAVIEGCGHVPPRECPPAFLEVLEPWLARLS